MGSPPPAIEPEYLHPDGNYTPPPPVRKPRPSWSYAPATYVLVGINCLVFLVMVAHRRQRGKSHLRSTVVLGG